MRWRKTINDLPSGAATRLGTAQVLREQIEIRMTVMERCEYARRYEFWKSRIPNPVAQSIITANEYP